jgi:N-acetylmuramoyl-L-alanine amidase
VTKPHATAIRFLTLAALIPVSAASLPALAQLPTFSRNVVVLDPAHGGTDTGARIADTLPEKQFTLSFVARLKPMLMAAGFTVVVTRDADPTEVVSNDQRAGTSNHVRAFACLLVHGTPSGSGVHLFTSSLPAETASPDAPLPWDSAQSAYIPLSLRLANELGVSLLHANIPPLLGTASTRPLDNLTCPAVALELAPLLKPNADSTPISDDGYQQRAAKAITDALVSWRNHAAPPAARPALPKPVPAPAAETPAAIPGGTR